MSELDERFQQLRSRIESAAFLVVKGGSEREAHTELLRALVALSEIEKACSPLEEPTEQGSERHQEEVNKVRNRLRLWARPERQHQINARILNAFLRLARSGVDPITEETLRRELPDVESFDSNFAQMKIISPKNHGKVFDQAGVAITIWSPVVPCIREYERTAGMVPAPLQSHTIVSVKIVKGSTLKPHWKADMQVITTNHGEYIDNMPGVRLGVPAYAKAGFDWASMIGKRVDGILVFALSDFEWLNKQ